jgi:DNA-directed RNA polymerase subunit RPC12/RpoP
MSDILFTCPKCSKNLAMDDIGAGKTIKCPDCQALIIAPNPTIFFSCASCACDLSAPAELNGQVRDCPNCRKEVLVTAKKSVCPLVCPHCLTDLQIDKDALDDLNETTIQCIKCNAVISLSENESIDIPENSKEDACHKICSVCGLRNYQDSEVCDLCEASLSSPSTIQTEKLCPKCHTSALSFDAVFCMKCGSSLVEDEISENPNKADSKSEKQGVGRPEAHESSRLKLKHVKPNDISYGVQNGGSTGAHNTDENQEWDCPDCSESLEVGAVVCVNCGLDLRTGKKIMMVSPSLRPEATNIAKLLFISILGLLLLVAVVANYRSLLPRNSSSGQSQSETKVMQAQHQQENAALTPDQQIADAVRRAEKARTYEESIPILKSVLSSFPNASNAETARSLLIRLEKEYEAATRSRLGETVEQCDERYGNPTRTGSMGGWASWVPHTSRWYTRDGIKISIHFVEGRASSIKYSGRSNIFTTDKAVQLLNSNTQGYRWSDPVKVAELAEIDISGGHIEWYRADGGLAQLTTFRCVDDDSLETCLEVRAPDIYPSTTHQNQALFQKYTQQGDIRGL